MKRKPRCRWEDNKMDIGETEKLPIASKYTSDQIFYVHQMAREKMGVQWDNAIL